MPLPRPEATPPVTKMNFGCAFTTGCDPSRRSRHAAGVRVGNVLARRCFSSRKTSERVEPAERRHRVDHPGQRDGLGDRVERDGDDRGHDHSPTGKDDGTRPSPMVKPSRLAPPSPSMARSRRSKPSATTQPSTTPGKGRERAEVHADARREHEKAELQRSAGPHVESVPHVGACRHQHHAREPGPSRPTRLEGDRHDGRRHDHDHLHDPRADTAGCQPANVSPNAARTGREQVVDQPGGEHEQRRRARPPSRPDHGRRPPGDRDQGGGPGGGDREPDPQRPRHQHASMVLDHQSSRPHRRRTARAVAARAIWKP